ncbi:hypothetical protein [Cryobacterium sp. N22]|uniref:hypothetical protein n=1 Tax=Cryobacterium sp. N22 TaxID=2048290 RepID=UPI0011B01E47|nr:hypothetical protein [Cryobacterium sp. N22]
MLAILAFGRLVFLVIRGGKLLSVFGRPVSRLALGFLGVFLAYGTAISVLGPFLFEGIEVFSPRDGLDQQVNNLSELSFSVSNFAQPVYVLLGCVVVLYLGMEREVSPRIFDVTMWVGLGLALARTVAPSLWPTALFENDPNVSYSVTQDGLRGTFGEPSLFGLFLSVCMAYALANVVVSHGRRRLLMIAALVLIVGELLLNLAWTALVVVPVVLVVAMVVGFWVLTRDRTRVRWVTVSAIGVVALVAAINVQFLVGLVLGLLDEKLSSLSFANRTASNDAAWSLFLDTWGVGVGLGSNRPSSLFFLLLSCVGIVGLVCFVGVVVLVALGALKVPSALPAASALLACVLAQFISAPELSMPLFWLLLGLVFWERPLEIQSERPARQMSLARTGNQASGLAVTDA